MMRNDRRAFILIAAATALTAVAAVASLLLGSYSLTLQDIAASFGQLALPRAEQAMTTRVFFGLRLPRTLSALLSGAGLGLCGGVYQMIFRSPLASPDLTGVSSGASLGAALAIVLGLGSSALRMGFAFLGGSCAGQSGGRRTVGNVYSGRHCHFRTCRGGLDGA